MKTAFTLCAAAAVSMTMLRAQDTPKPTTTKTMTADETFQWYDANNDGFLTREEIIAKPLMKTAPPAANEKMADIMMKKDADGDGKISKKEWTAGGERAADMRFARFDTNRDGVITKEEFMSAPSSKAVPDKAESMFKSFDKDGDGKITKAEWPAPSAPAPAAPAPPK